MCPWHIAYLSVIEISRSRQKTCSTRGPMYRARQVYLTHLIRQSASTQKQSSQVTSREEAIFFCWCSMGWTKWNLLICISIYKNVFTVVALRNLSCCSYRIIYKACYFIQGEHKNTPWFQVVIKSKLTVIFLQNWWLQLHKLKQFHAVSHTLIVAPSCYWQTSVR